MTAPAPELFTDFQKACRVITTGDGFGLPPGFDRPLWFAGPVAVLRYVRRLLAGVGNSREEYSKALGAASELLQGIVDHSSNDTAREVLNTCFGPTNIHPDHGEQLRNWAIGVAQTTLAAIELHQLQRRLPAGQSSLHQRIADSIQSLRQAWPLHSDSSPEYVQYGDDQERNATHTSSSLLNQTLKYFKAVSLPHFLMVRRTLGYLLSEDNEPQDIDSHAQSATPVTRAQLLATRKLFPCFIEPADEPVICYYLDPVGCGFFSIDNNLSASMQFVWARASDRMSQQRNRGVKIPGTALRLRPVPPKNGYQITGASAGGLLAVGLYLAAIGESLDEDATATVTIGSDGQLGGVDGGEKLKNKFAVAKDAGLKRVIIWEAQQELPEAPTGLTIVKVRSFEAAVAELSGNAAKERLLADFCQKHVAHWQELIKPGADPMALEFYQAHAFSRLTSDSEDDLTAVGTDTTLRHTDPRQQSYKPLCPAHYPEDDKFRLLFQDSKQQVLICEDAGAGKSVCSRRLVAWLSDEKQWPSYFEGRPCLAVRLESGDWPAMVAAESAWGAYRRKLAETVAIQLTINIQVAIELLDYVLQEGRLVLVLDAYDQLPSPNSSERPTSRKGTFAALIDYLEKTSVGNPKVGKNRVIVTSRERAIDADRSPEQRLFNPLYWTYCRLEGFNSWQQLCYLRDVLESTLGPSRLPDGWDQQFAAASERARETNAADLEQFAAPILRDDAVFGPAYDAELLKSPVILRFVRELATDRKRKHKLRFPRFSNRADLYFQLVRMLFERNLKKVDSPEIKANRDDYILRFMEILSAVAFQMMAVDARSYYVTDVATLKRKTKELIGDEQILSEWDFLWTKLSDVAGLTKFLVVERSLHDFFGWKHLGMMEFFCGLFLARNSCPDWFCKDPAPDNPLLWTCGIQRLDYSPLADYAANPDWHWPFRFALGLAVASSDVAREYKSGVHWAVSLNALLECSSKFRRPGNLIFDAWSYYLIAAEKSTHQPALEAVWYCPLHQCECLPQLRQVTAEWQQWVCCDVDAWVESLGTGGLGDLKSQIREPRQRCRKPAQLTSCITAGRVPEEVWTAFLNWSKLKPLPPARADQILFGGVLRFLAEHRLLWHGAAGEETRAQMVEFEAGFRRIPGKPDVADGEDGIYQQAARDGNMLRCWLGDDSRFSNGNAPVHMGQISAPFLLHQHATTYALYRLFDPLHQSDKDRSTDDRCPVIEVDLYDSWACATWFGGCLPDEVQWEFACRGQLWRGQNKTLRTLYYFGIESSFADDDKNDAAIWELVNQHTWNYTNTKSAQPVGRKGRNPFGLYDMLGNVWEWTWSPYLADPQTLIEAQGVAKSLVVRGGSYNYDNLGELGSSRRFDAAPKARRNRLGFRIGQVIPGLPRISKSESLLH